MKISRQEIQVLEGRAILDILVESGEAKSAPQVAALISATVAT
jgi:hypothetical protein